MFDLKTASIGIRKAAALKGIWSGKVYFLEIENSTVEVINKNNPEGVIITGIDRNAAASYTWSEIRKMMRSWDNCEDVTQEFIEIRNKNEG